MKILFIALFNLTEVFLAIRKRLEENSNDIEIYWYVSDTIRYEQLIAAGIPSKRILHFLNSSNDLDLSNSASIIADLSIDELENSRTFSMNLKGDRFVKNKRSLKEFNEGLLQFKRSKEFIKENDIGLVFGEPTNRDILMIALVSEALKVPFLFPQDARIPHNNFFFQEGVSSSKIYSGNNTNCDDDAEEIFKAFKERPKPPQSFNQVNERLSPNALLKKLINRISSINKKNTSLVHHAFLRQLNEYSTAILRTFYLNNFFNYDKITLEEERYVYYPLHVQPELSIDVLAPFYSDQYKLISDIAISLPSDTKLIVKEHTNFIGQKPLKLFKELKKLPNVYVVHHNTHSIELIKNADIVFTISGTAGLEAGLLSIPSIVFCDIFYKNLPSVHFCNNIQELKKIIKNIRSSKEIPLELNQIELQKNLNSFYKGFWVDANSQPSVMSEENIINLTNGFYDVIISLKND